MTKCGYVSVVGRPNAGKSSLLNWLVGEKIAMVSHKANATRRRSNIIVMHEDDQIVFVDTPGIHETEKLLNQFMLDEALKAMGDCDLILFLAPVTDSLKYYEDFLEKNKKNEFYDRKLLVFVIAIASAIARNHFVALYKMEKQKKRTLCRNQISTRIV